MLEGDGFDGFGAVGAESSGIRCTNLVPICAWSGPLIRSRYSSVAPVMGSVTALAKCLWWCVLVECRRVYDAASRVSAAMERARYRVLC